MSKIDFSYLIAPHTVDDFFSEFWQQRSLLVQRGEPERFRDLLPASDAEAVLGMADQLPTGTVELIGKTDATEHRRPESSSALVGFFNSGSTIRVKGVERYFDPIAELCRSIERDLGFPTRANLYCTPADSRGFDLHFDTHEVLVLQLLGRKQWLAYESTTKLPVEHMPLLPFDDARDTLKRSPEGSSDAQDEISVTERQKPAVDALLEAGDSLYLPRGFFHQAESLDEHSVHLTIGIHVFTWLDLLSVALVQSGYPELDECCIHKLRQLADVRYIRTTPSHTCQELRPPGPHYGRWQSCHCHDRAHRPWCAHSHLELGTEHVPTKNRDECDDSAQWQDTGHRRLSQ